jgi:hypothetical protein
LRVVAQVPDENSTAARRARLKAALHEEWEYQLRTYPNSPRRSATIDITTASVIIRRNSIAGQVQHARQALQIFESIDTKGFPEQERLSNALMIRTCASKSKGRGSKTGKCPSTR